MVTVQSTFTKASRNASPLFSLQFAELVKVFDSLPEMCWNTIYDELHLEGEIDGEDAWITLQKLPFQDDQPQWLIEGGVLRRRDDSG